VCGRVLKSLRLFLKVFSIKPEVQPAIRRGALGTRTWTSAGGREAVDDIQEQLGKLSPTGLAARQGPVVGEGGEASLPQTLNQWWKALARPADRSVRKGLRVV